MCSLYGRNFISEGHECSKKRKVIYYLTKTSLCTCFFPNFELFPVPPLPHLSKMSTLFCDKVPVLKYKTECEESTTFGELITSYRIS